jgi:hypothetical protein
MPVTYNTFKSETGFDGAAGIVQAGVGGKIAYYPANGTEVNDLTALTWTPGTNTLAITGTLTASQFIGPGIGAVLGDTPPLQPYAQSGTIWFDTSSGKLYIYYDDGTSQQWVQPMTPSYGGGGGGGGSGTVGNGIAGRLAYYPSSGSTIDDLSNLSFASNTLSVTGSINVSAQKNYVRFHWDSLIDLNNEADPVTWHGMIAHVHSTGRVYFAHAGAWTALANLSDLGSGVSGILAGDNITINNNNGIVTINAVAGGGGGGISLEDAQDGAATLFANGVHNGITFVYNDASNAINATVDVALGTGTSGNYVASVASGNGLTGGAVGSEGANLTLAIDTSIVTTLTGSQTLINKVINGSSNTITNIGNAALTNSAITINGTPVSLGGTITVTGSGATTLDSLTDVIITSASSGQVLKYNGTNWINDTDATGGGGANTFSSFAVAGQSTVVADNSTDTFTLAAGTGIQITTDSTLDVITITNNASVFNTIAVAGQSDVVADTATETLTLVGGTGIQITTNTGTDTVTITSTVTAGATTFAALTDNANLTIDQIYLPAITRLNVTNNSASSYRFDQYGVADNPTIFALNGATIAFNLSVAGHPFLIQTSGGSNYNTGLVHVSTTGTVITGASAQGQTSGTLYWKIPNSISGNYRYICSIHGGMVGIITIKDFVSI